MGRRRWIIFVEAFQLQTTHSPQAHLDLQGIFKEIAVYSLLPNDFLFKTVTLHSYPYNELLTDDLRLLRLNEPKS